MTKEQKIKLINEFVKSASPVNLVSDITVEGGIVNTLLNSGLYNDTSYINKIENLNDADVDTVYTAIVEYAQHILEIFD